MTSLGFTSGPTSESYNRHVKVCLLSSVSYPSELASRFGKTLKDEGGEDEEAEHDLGIAHLDSDTAISKRSYDAALFAAGSLCQAVDMVQN